MAGSRESMFVVRFAMFFFLIGFLVGALAAWHKYDIALTKLEAKFIERE